MLLLLLSQTAHSQKTRAFKGRLKILDGTKKDIFNIGVRLVGQGSSYTGSDGSFVIPINENTGSVTLELSSGKFDIVYPVNGVIGVPKDSSVITDFIVGSATKDILVKAIAQSRNELKGLLVQQGLQQQDIQQALANILAGIQKTTGIKTEDLDNQIDLDNQKKEFYPVLSAAINNYTNEAKDLKDAFKFIARHAFDDPQALQVLTDAVNTYNAAYQDLNNKHNAYEKSVNDLWRSDAKTAEVRDLFSYALGELHSANIFVLNLKIRDINDYNLGNFSGSKKAFKERILHEIETSQLQLERRLQELDNRSQVLLSKLMT